MVEVSTFHQEGYFLSKHTPYEIVTMEQIQLTWCIVAEPPLPNTEIEHHNYFALGSHAWKHLLTFSNSR